MSEQQTAKPLGAEEEAQQDKREALDQRLLETRAILLSEPVNKESAQDVVARLLLLDHEDSKAPIDLYINSPGGEVDAGFAIFDMIRFIDAPVRCISAGLTASAAVIVLLATDKKNRLSLPNSRFLLHQPSTGVSGSTADIQIEATEILKIRQKINQIIAEETGKKIDEVENDTRRNYWLDADQAKKYGLVARIVKSRKELEK